MGRGKVAARGSAGIHLLEERGEVRVRQRSALEIFGQLEERVRSGEGEQPQERRVHADEDAARRQGRVRGELGRGRPGGAAELRRLAAEVEQALRFVPDPLLSDGALLVALLSRSQAGERRRLGIGRAALRDPAREHLVPAGRAVPSIDVGALREDLQLGGVALAARERKRLVDAVEQQLGEVQGRLRPLGEPGPEPVLERARQLPLGSFAHCKPPETRRPAK